MKKLTSIVIHLGGSPLSTTVVNAAFQDYLVDGRRVGDNMNAHFSLVEARSLVTIIDGQPLDGETIALAFIALIEKFSDRAAQQGETFGLVEL